jgi:hypothetical protein
MPNDTIYLIKDTVFIQPRQIDSVDILDKVNNFYNSSMTILLTVGGIFVTVFGIIIPFLQRRSLKIQEENLKRQFEQQLLLYKTELTNLTSQNIDRKIEEYLKQLKDLEQTLQNNQEFDRTSIEGRLYHLEGYFQQEFKKYTWAISSFMRCIDNYVKTNDVANIGVVLDNINECLDNIDKKDLETIKNFRNYSVRDFLNKFNFENDKLLYARNLRQVKVKLDLIENYKPTDNVRVTN